MYFFTHEERISMNRRRRSEFTMIEGLMRRIYVLWLFVLLACHSTQPQPNTVDSMSAEDHAARTEEYHLPPDPVDKAYERQQCEQNRKSCISSCKVLSVGGFVANLALAHMIGAPNSTDSGESRCNYDNPCPFLMPGR